MRTRQLLLGIVGACAIAGPAFAAGANLAWNDCGSFGVCNQSFACDVNGPGVFTLVGSFVAPEGVTQLVGIESRVDFYSNNGDGTMPDWWRFKTVGSCRMAGVTADAFFALGPYSCVDPWQGQAVGGLAGWSIGSEIGPGVPGNGGRMVMAFALPGEFVGPLVPGEHYYAFRVLVNKSKSVGGGACAGCSQPGGFIISSMKIVQPVGVGDLFLNTWEYQGFAAWQNGMYPVYDVAYMCPFVIPAKNRTWGSIESLYH